MLILADERSNKLIVITSKTNMDFFDKIIKTLDVETTPEVSVEVIRLKYADAEEVASMLNDLIGAGSSSSQSKNNQNPNANRGAAATRSLTTQRPAAPRPGAARSPTFQNANASRLGELNKDNVKVLADKRINGIVVMARKADMRAIKDVIENMDVKLSQVLIETVIIEITLGDDLKTGIDWLQRGRNKTTQTDSTGAPLYWAVYDKDILDANNNILRRAGDRTGLTTTANYWQDSSGIYHLLEPVRGISRGGLVNEADLDKALEEKVIAGAALDVTEKEPMDFDSPLLRHENFIVTPHMAWYSEQAASELKRKVAEEAVRFAKGEPLRSPVNKI